ncbi:UV-damage endonuclease [Tolypocladium ophioglossoides CBS 100239]|uniref:UV-damage endonuclease n=1 Tax=Tolypocladium ophioglossoides (strain CBS 100239) TaxID=1163406 RepID=A0A0L0ND47_TOLOC|nr:UV-damage endonuclease [Tolypocladium ophioglossoides CBS 100239]
MPLRRSRLTKSVFYPRRGEDMLLTSSRLAASALRRICVNAASLRARAPRNLRFRRFIAVATAMPPKRKRTEPHPTPPRPEAPRRSTRRAKDVPELEHGANGPAKEDLTQQNKAGNAWTSREAVQRAMQDLSEMEQKLQDEARRQRLAVESSDCSVDTEAAAKWAVHITSKSAAEEIMPENYKDKPSTRPVEQLVGDELGGNQDDIPEAAVEDDGQDRGARRPPPINSDILPLPWSGRLGYACLNTYLRSANPPVFSSRTCRLGSIIEHRHPLQDPSQPEHPTKNRPDKTKPADIKRGLEYVQAIGLANARDIVKMIRWNNKYGIRFMRLSSEMFPFASHADYGYKLAPFASEALAEAGRLAAELGHRITTHPGQFTQIASPRKEVIVAAIRDLEYHDEMLSLLKLPDQPDRDAVIILHMGGAYGDKAATLDRFRGTYATLSDGVKRRLVLENDDVVWCVHDLLPVCEELNIPLVLDFHHHNILFDPCVREGTQDIIALYDRIRATWTRKKIAQKMHYSESTASAVTPRDRRKHSARVKTLPPCAPDMDLMIEAKDKEQAVFELMRTFKLPGWDRFNDIVPHERDDEFRKAVMKKAKKGKGKQGDVSAGSDVEVPERVVSPESFGMGGSENRVYWPEGMQEWLRPRKRELKKNKNGDE